MPNTSLHTPSTRRRRGTGTAILAVGAAITGLLLCSASPDAAAAAKDDAVNPMSRHFASLQVGPGHEFRLLVIHPLFAPATAVGPEKARLATGANPNTYGFSAPSAGRVEPLRLDNLVDDRLLVMPGQIVRSDRFDLAFTAHVAVKSKNSTDSPLVVVSDAAPDDAPRPERVVLPEWLPPTLRWASGPEGNPRELQETFREWARDAGVKTGRKTMADLARGTIVQERVTEYVRAVRELSRAPPGLQTVGYAAILDGAPLVIETFGDGSLFSAAWPGLVQALAVESAVQEARNSLLEEEMPPTGQPDRMLPAVRQLLLSFYEKRPEFKNARQTGKSVTVNTQRGTLHGLFLDKSVFTHAVLVTDPRRRATDEEDEFDPGVISRKARPTEAEKRWLDRRNKRNPPPPVPPQPPVPPVPDIPTPPK